MTEEHAPSGPDQIVRDILRGLTDGRFVAGQRLAEPDLMRRYALSRGTVREALNRLAAEGVVDLAPHRGAQIRFLTRRAAADVLRVSELLLGLGARQAAEAVAAGVGSAAEFAAAATEYLALAEGGDPALSRARARFYRALGRLAGNRELDRLLPSMQVHLIRAQLRPARAGGVSEHRALVRAVLAGAPDRAESIARRHVRRLIAALPDLPDEAFAPETEW